MDRSQSRRVKTPRLYGNKETVDRPSAAIAQRATVSALWCRPADERWCAHMPTSLHQQSSVCHSSTTIERLYKLVAVCGSSVRAMSAKWASYRFVEEMRMRAVNTTRFPCFSHQHATLLLAQFAIFIFSFVTHKLILTRGQTVPTSLPSCPLPNPARCHVPAGGNSHLIYDSGPSTVWAAAAVITPCQPRCSIF